MLSSKEIILQKFEKVWKYILKNDVDIAKGILNEMDNHINRSEEREEYYSQQEKIGKTSFEKTSSMFLRVES